MERRTRNAHIQDKQQQQQRKAKQARTATGEQWKTYLPEGASVVHDQLKQFRFVMTFDHRKMPCDPDRVRLLKPHLVQASKAITFGKNATLSLIHS